MRYSLFILVALLTFGCSVKYGEFAMISTKKIDPTKTYERGDSKVIGKDMIKIYFLIPTEWHPDASEAVTDALENNCAEYLSDVTLTLKHWYIPYIYGKSWFEVEGYPWFLEGVDRQNCLKKEEISKSNQSLEMKSNQQ